MCMCTAVPTYFSKTNVEIICIVLQRCKCVDIHRSGERVSSGPAKGTTESGANWSYEGLTYLSSLEFMEF